jgi:RNA polymerase sigma-70 factor (sigma-E family)
LKDRPSIEDYVAARGQGLLRFAFVLTGTLPDAEDLVQEGLARLLPRWRKVLDARNADAYVRKAMLNILVDDRRRKRSREIPSPLVETVNSTTEADHSIGIVDRDETMRWLATLPPRQRAVIALRYLEDFPDTQIAELLGCSEGTVRSQASRALATLKLSRSTFTVNGLSSKEVSEEDA